MPPCPSIIIKHSRHWVAAGICLVASFVLFGPLVLNPTGVLGKKEGVRNDLTSFYAPAREFHSQQIWQGNLLPGWDPHLMCGRPFAANPQTSIYYPPNWLCSFGSPATLLSWLTVLHHTFAGLGVYFLCRGLRVSWWPAVLGGVLFIVAPCLIAHSVEGHFGQITCVSWLPWALWAWEKSRHRPAFVLVAAVVLALSFFCGHVQELYYAVLLLGWLSLCETSRRVATRDWQALVHPLGRLCLIGAFSAGLACINLLPTYLVSKESTRGVTKFDPQEVQSGSVAFSQIGQIIDPLALGGPSDFRGNGYFWETLAAVSTTALLFAIVAFAWPRWRYRTVQYGVATLFFLLLAIGAYSPAYTELISKLPGMGMFRIPARAMFLVSLTLCVLAAIGLHGTLRWLGTLAPDLRRKLIIAAGSCGCLLLAVGLAAWLWASMPADAIVQIRWAPFCLMTAALSVCLLLALMKQKQLACGGIIACTLMQGCYLSWHIMGVHSVAEARGSDLVAKKLVESNGKEFSRTIAPQHLLSDYQAVAHNTEKLRGYDPFLMQRYILYLSAIGKDRELTSAEAAGDISGNIAQYEPELLALGNVGRLVTADPKAKDGYAVAELTPLPRAFVVGNAAKWKPAQSVTQLKATDFRQQVLLPADVLADGPRAEFTPAKVLLHNADKVEIEVTTSAPGYLVLTDTFSRGWTAKVNGQPSKVLPANVAFRAVALDKPGKHQVTFIYSPPGFQAAATISLMTVLAMGVWLLRLNRKATPEAEDA
jgi:hypothetical protein